MPKNLKLSIIIVILFVSYDVFSLESFIIRPVVREGYEVKDDRIFLRSGNGGLIVKCVRGNDVPDYYSERGAAWIGNPFLRPEFANPTIFIVTVFNRTNGSATFTPGLVTIKIKDEASFPVDFVALMGALEALPSREQKILRDSIFHSPETLRPGEVISKFLLFPPLPDKNLEFKLEFDYLYFESKEVRGKFYFTKERIRAKE